MSFRKQLVDKYVTQEKIAQRFKVSQVAVSKWLRGGLPAVSRAMDIADDLGIDVADIYRDEVNPPKKRG